MKILIIRFSSIGDIVLTTPIIRCLKNKYPNSSIHYLTKEKFVDVIRNNPYISNIYSIKEDIHQVIFSLLKEDYNYIIDLHNNIRSWQIKHILKQKFNTFIKTYTVKKLNKQKMLLTQFKINLLPDKSIVERYFDTVKKLNVTNDGQGLQYFISPQDEITTDDIPHSHIYGFVACAIGGQHFTKKMPVEKWKQILSAIQYPIILLGGKEDAANAELIKQIDEVKIYNACGKFSLNESAHIIKKSSFVITHDTGLMHIAAAFKKNIISIWGNTVPQFGMFPYYGYNNLKTNISPLLSIIENNKISCRPCSKIGYSKCPKTHFNCMNKIDTELIVQTANKIITTINKKEKIFN